MNILIAPNGMKGSLSADKFAEAVERAFAEPGPSVFKIKKIPVADGGDGTADVLIRALALKRYRTIVKDPLGRKIEASFGYADGLAVIEMADASGLRLLKPKDINPLKATSFGTGQLIAEAIRYGARKVLLGVGGSATVDGGTGMLEALGVKFYNSGGNMLAGNGENLIQVSSINLKGMIVPKDTVIKIISDVDNRLLGDDGAARVFGPQKGATPEMIEFLDRGLTRFENVIRQKTGIATADLKGSGAAGGIAIGLVAFLNAQIVQGAEFILKQLSFNKYLRWADAVITGEGRLDNQSLQNKVPYVVARKAKKLDKKVYAIVGASILQDQNIFDRVLSLTDEEISAEYAINKAEYLVYSKSKELASLIL